MESEGVAAVLRRAEIDTRAPFRSVKEAVTLFGERVLAGELYANKLKEMRVAADENRHGFSSLGTVAADLEETKETLKKAREEGLLMANCLSTLKEELEHTKRELQQLKVRESDKQPINSEIEDLKRELQQLKRRESREQSIDSEIEDLKFVENAKNIEIPIQKVDEGINFERKRYVKFANPPSMARILTSEGVEVLERHPSLKKKKKKPLIPLIGAIFSKNKGSQDH